MWFWCRYSDTKTTSTAGLPGDFRSAVFGPEGVEAALSVHAAVRVRAEEVAQPLDERSREAFRAERMVVGERRREPGHRDPVVDRAPDHHAPAVLRLGDFLGEVRVGEQ